MNSAGGEPNWSHDAIDVLRLSGGVDPSGGLAPFLGTPHKVILGRNGLRVKKWELFRDQEHRNKSQARFKFSRIES
jgi:hypothetical protein